EAIEDRFQLVAVGGENTEALLQRGAHRVQGTGEVTDLVAAAYLEVGVEGPSRKFSGSTGETPDAEGDAYRDQEAGENPQGDRAKHSAGAIAEEVDNAGGQQRHRREGADQPEPDPDPPHQWAFPFHEGLLTQRRRARVGESAHED